jgi:hypothetical protein
MSDTSCLSTSRRRTPWNKGKLVGAKPSASAKPSLVDPN